MTRMGWIKRLGGVNWSVGVTFRLASGAKFSIIPCMSRRIKPNAQLLAEILAAIPEGFISHSMLAERFKFNSRARSELNEAAAAGKIGMTGNLYYDPARLTHEQVVAMSRWARPEVPPISDKQVIAQPISERRAERDQHIRSQGQADALAVMERIASLDGYAEKSAIDDEAAVRWLLQEGMLQQHENLIFDPLRVSRRTVKYAYERLQLLPKHAEALAWLASQPGQVTRTIELIEFLGGRDVWKQVQQLGGFLTFDMSNRNGALIQWVRPLDADHEAAELVVKRALRKLQREVEAKSDLEWGRVAHLAGDVVRPGARDGKRAHARVIARSYTVEKAARRLMVKLNTMVDAIQAGRVPMFRAPDGSDRVPASVIEAAVKDAELREEITAYETLRVKMLAIVAGAAPSTMRARLKRAGLSTTRPKWGDVRGKWDLPATLWEFRDQLKEKSAEWYSMRVEAMTAAEERRREVWRVEQERERKEREELRARLVAAFPAWRHAGRANQKFILHIGPTNSGKTYDALIRLSEAGSGWYLAPLRLLAFEIFDTLNARGVKCNLLTGEERIDTPGALITAATVEMFNPNNSGDCVLIDEAHLLADPDRGWAWTRALMEAQAPEIHVIGAPTARNLVERLARAAAVEIEVVEHERLTPLEIAPEAWSIDQLPPRTILVAFSRASVLSLKVALEERGRRVSVVYGNLPPEVRRRQADRFAAGETEICVATDAVGMGLNLPADQVCFAEVYKFDGRQSRVLYPDEVRQIGGRAGRYKLSKVGLVGAMTDKDLEMIADLFNAPLQDVTHARVAPTVEDLTMIPGHLAERLHKWAALSSIPDTLRGAIMTADMDERIELASMLEQQEIEMLGLGAAMKLINAPTQQNTRSYWRTCATAILYDDAMPLPPTLRARIQNHADLEWAELCIRSADIYLWLSSRREFQKWGREVARVRDLRSEWSRLIDEALVRKVDASPRCRECGKRLPYGHRFKICESCFRDRAYRRW